MGAAGLETAAGDAAAYADVPNQSPWVAQLAPDGPPRPLASDGTADVVVVGAGIAGIATAFFLLRSTSAVVMLLERDRVGRGASGYNAGQLTTYFERPLSDIALEYGWEPAAAAQRDVEGAQALLDVMVAEAGASVRVERFTGRLGMFNRHQLEVHLRCALVDHLVEDVAGRSIRLSRGQRITGRIGHMVAFSDTPRLPATISYIRNAIIGGETAYVYVTRRTYDDAGGTVMLTCMGGPEHPRTESTYDRDALFPAALLEELDREVRPFAQPARPPGRPYDFHWHGLMGYNDSGIRVIGAHPRHRRLLYNLGCNGVGFLPSIHGGQRVARLLAGDDPGPSVFDPR